MKSFHSLIWYLPLGGLGLTLVLSGFYQLVAILGASMGPSPFTRAHLKAGVSIIF